MAAGVAMGVAERTGRTGIGSGLFPMGAEGLSDGSRSADRGDHSAGNYSFLNVFGGGKADRALAGWGGDRSRRSGRLGEGRAWIGKK